MTAKLIDQLHRTLSRVAGMPNLPEKIRNAAAEAALESGADQAVAALADAWIAAEADAAAVKPQLQALNDRHKANKEAISFIRDVLLQHMQDTGAGALDAGAFKLSLTKGRRTARVTDVEKLPSRFVKVEKTVKQAELNTAVLKDGEVIEGAEASNGAPFVSIERKRHAA